jgi:zinc finger protein
LESFSCPHCFAQDNSVKSASQIQVFGTKYTLVVDNEEDLQRQVIKSDVAIFKLETLEIEMPKGESQLSNVEGMLQKIHSTLESEQDLRKAQAPELYNALQPIIEKIALMLKGEAYPFTISIDDITGNSFIAPTTHDTGNKYKRRDYPRSHEQNEELGIAADPDAQKAEAQNMIQSAGNPEDLDIIDGQVYTLPAECPGCAKSCVVNMQKVSIPHFKEVFIWATICDHCGYKTNEVKTGGAVPEKGKRLILKVESTEDLSRDILKSDTCALFSHELEMSVQPGTLGGRFTTVEGLLTEVRDQLHGQIFDVGDTGAGDSLSSSDKETWTRFFDRLDSAIKGELKFVITLEDPLANSYVQNLHLPDPDPQLQEEEYTRTEEEEEDLGLKDMKTEGYEQDDEKKETTEQIV